MGSVGLGVTAELGAFQNRLYPEGLDLGRCQIKEALGIYVADPNSTFRAGMAVMRNASGLIVPSTGLDFLGVAKWNHTTNMYSVIVDEAIVLVGVAATNLKYGTVSNVRVAAAVKGVTPWVVTTDYVVTAGNGQITRAGGASLLASGATVYVTYTFQVPEATLLQMQGKNFWNSMDEVSQNDGRVTVITDSELLFTTQYDSTMTYTLTGGTAKAGSNIYASVAQPGLFTSDSASSAVFVGRVFQVPSATDPFLGIRLSKATVAAAP